MRFSDNPGFCHAAQYGRVLPVYIVEQPSDHSTHHMGEASKCWVRMALTLLKQQQKNGLSLETDDPLHIIQKLVASYQIQKATRNRCYEPWRIET